MKLFILGFISIVSTSSFAANIFLGNTFFAKTEASVVGVFDYDSYTNAPGPRGLRIPESLTKDCVEAQRSLNEKFATLTHTTDLNPFITKLSNLGVFNTSEDSEWGTMYSAQAGWSCSVSIKKEAIHFFEVKRFGKMKWKKILSSAKAHYYQNNAFAVIVNQPVGYSPIGIFGRSSILAVHLK